MTCHEHEGHGLSREWTSEPGLSNQWLKLLINISDIALNLTEQVVSLGVAFQFIPLTPAFPRPVSLIRRLE